MNRYHLLKLAAGLCLLVSTAGSGYAAETARMPRALTFEANKGQADKQVRFLSRGEGYHVSFTSQGMALDLTPDGAGKGASTDPAPLRLRLVGARTRIAVGLWKSGDREVEISYHSGKRRKNVSTYKKVLYERVYPGVNLVYYGQATQIEYDFVVNPRAKIDPIRLAFEGAERIERTEDGELRIFTAGGEVRQKKPVIYQTIDGARREIPGGYLLEAGNQVRFQVGEYDPAYPLVIDPILMITPR